MPNPFRIIISSQSFDMIGFNLHTFIVFLDQSDLSFVDENRNVHHKKEEKVCKA